MPPPRPTPPPLPRKKSKAPTAKMPVVGWVFLFMAWLVVISSVVFYGPPRNEVGQEAKKKLTRDEVRALIEGKSRAEVIKAIGKPDSTRDDDGTEVWLYRDIATDPITDKSSSFDFIFRKGKDEAVNLGFF